ncbi:ion transporter [Alloscardovia theropitheci]|uniref:Ion transporter n=1 Tax=Alloscardovia theropitheci TaxID=2496842 RepID=A0A4R0QP21_9BIFI|nr:potassium channel family protein [Alloscardovia theropitheci]TCD53953.1 ion transporter [Alloscardovia theropitheci]
MNRQKLWFLIEPDADQDVSVYDKVMMAIIVVSLVPLMMGSNIPEWAHWLDIAATIVFLLDYILHWICADFSEHPENNHRSRFWRFLLYPFRPIAIVDLLSILPGFFPLNHGLRIFRLVRLLRIVRGLMIFRNIRRRRSVDLIVTALKKQRESFTIIFCIAIGYIFVSALIVFNVEPQTFKSFFDALYWATVSLTTVGYGDIYPVTVVGRLFTMLSSILGIAVIALPSSILTADLMIILNDNDDDESNDVSTPTTNSAHQAMSHINLKEKNSTEEQTVSTGSVEHEEPKSA